MPDPVILGTATALPPICVTQSMAKEYAGRRFHGHISRLDRLLEVFDHAEIDTRYVCEPPEWWETAKGFGDKNAAYIHWATELGKRAAQGALEKAGVEASEVDAVLFISSTGLSTPSIDARLMLGLGLRPDVRRMPLWGLGCAGGAMGLARARDLLLGNPDGTVLVIAVELCSLTFMFDDYSIQNLIGLALFGDGAAAVVLRGEGAGPRIRAARSMTWPELTGAAGWTILDEGMQVVFGRELPEITRQNAGADIRDFLESNGTSPEKIDHFVFHPGGVKVIEAYQDALDLKGGELNRTQKIMREIGNASSPTVLFVLENLLAEGFQPGQQALVHALGPGFSSENLLLES